jgi:hypothetical protein
MPHCAREAPSSVRTLHHVDVQAGAPGQFFKLTRPVRIIHSFGAFVHRIVGQLIRRYRNRKRRGIVHAVLGTGLVCRKIEGCPDCNFHVGEILRGRDRCSGVGKFCQAPWKVRYPEAVRLRIENGAVEWLAAKRGLEHLTFNTYVVRKS